MKKWRIFFIMLGLILILFVLSLFGQIGSLKNNFWKINAPLNDAGNKTFGRLPSFFLNIVHLRSILKENANLVEENLNLQSKLAKLSEAEYENEVLKKELGFLRAQNQQTLLSTRVIGRSSNGYSKALVIDKGENENLHLGQAIVSQGYLVGTVTEIRKDSAEITLITHFNSLVPVTLQESRGTGLIRGGLQGLIIDDIPLNTEIKKR